MTAGLVDPSSFSNGPCSVRKQQVSFSVSIRGVRRINAFTKTFIIITVIWPNEKCGRPGAVGPTKEGSSRRPKDSLIYCIFQSPILQNQKKNRSQTDRFPQRASRLRVLIVT